MPNIAELPGIEALWRNTQGNPKVRIAILDGLVDQSHVCFQGANLLRLPTLVPGEAIPEGTMSNHGTHVASIIFGQPNASVQGIAPRCTGLLIPVFSDTRRSLSQLDLSRAIEQAFNAGAHIINISGGQLTDMGEAEPALERAINLCRENNILVIAAAGNDGCDCLHVPAALPAVLAVGAMDRQGKPLGISNWGQTYQIQGILAPGENILGAQSGGHNRRLSGTSFAAPIVTGIAASLLSLQVQAGQKPNPQAVRAALLDSALPCNLGFMGNEPRCLVGKLNISGAQTLIIDSLVAIANTRSTPVPNAASKPHTIVANSVATMPAGTLNKFQQLEPANPIPKLQLPQHPTIIGGTMSEHDPATVDASGCECGGTVDLVEQAESESSRQPKPEVIESASASTHTILETPERSSENTSIPAAMEPSLVPSMQVQSAAAPEPISATPSPSNLTPTVSSTTPSTMTPSMPDPTAQVVTPSQSATGTLVYVIGTLGYDFGTEARRDSFKQLMPAISIDGTGVPANPYDARQMAAYLEANPSEAKALIWTLNLELMPIYAIEAEGPFAGDIYALVQDFLAGQIEAETSPEYIQRVSIPARLTGRTVRLFSGQILPVVEIQNVRGLYGWKINTLVEQAIGAALEDASQRGPDAPSEEAIRSSAMRSLESFLNRVYYDLRNLGSTSQDRALNFAATNAFQAAQTFIRAIVDGMQLETISVQKSPFCRLGSDCWDVQLKFFDPENRRRARKIYRFTIDVSDLVPVTLGEVRTWTAPY